MTQELTADENVLLTHGIGTVGTASAGPSAGWGARMVARLLPADVFETVVTLPLPAVEAAALVRRVLAELGAPIDEQTAGDTRTLRAMVGAGAMNLNPAVVTVRLTGKGPDATTAQIRGVAKEGLIRQHAGRGAAERTATRLIGS